MKFSLFLQILAFVLTRVVLNTMLRMVYPFLPALSRGLGVDLVAISTALTIRSTTGFFSPFLATIADLRGRKTGMLLGLFFFTLGAGLVYVWPVFPVFVLTLVLTVLGNSIFSPSMQAYIGDRVDYSWRGRALAFTEFGWSLAFIAGIPVMGFLIARADWRAPFLFLAGCGLLAIFLLTWLVPRDEPKPDAQREPVLGNLRKIAAYPPALAGLLFGLLFNAGNEVVNVVFGVWMENSFGLQIAALGAASAVIGFSELGGEVLAGGLSDLFGKPRSLTLGLAVNSLAVLALPLISRSLTGALIGLFLYYLTYEFTLVCSIPVMTEVFPPARASMMALFIAGTSLGRGVGALFAAPLYDLLPSISGNVMGTLLVNLLAFMVLSRVFRRVNEPAL